MSILLQQFFIVHCFLDIIINDIYKHIKEHTINRLNNLICLDERDIKQILSFVIYDLYHTTKLKTLHLKAQTIL